MTPQAALAPAFPVFRDSSCFSSIPLPKSSTPTWTTKERPMIEVSPDKEINLSVKVKAAVPLTSDSTFPRSPTWRSESWKRRGILKIQSKGYLRSSMSFTKGIKVRSGRDTAVGTVPVLMNVKTVLAGREALYQAFYDNWLIGRLKRSL